MLGPLQCFQKDSDPCRSLPGVSVIHPRLRLAMLAAVACALAALAGVALASGGDGAREDQAVVNGFVGSLRPPGIPPKDFRLTDQDGEPVSLRQLRGEPLILTFLYTTCEDTCPQQAQTIRGALDRAGVDVPALAVSVDPANDTEKSAKRFLVKQRATGRIRFLLGSRAQLQPIWKAYGIRPQGDAFDHSAYILLVDRRGVQRVGFPVEQATPEGIAHDLRVLLDERR